ncbi:polysaccharide pyruvyl transferase family protein [Rhodohalobacter sulfatireducens]|uniref:Polysaccharide pyruvyl transferase family protein n=1 Tax=Rhodohalobacter sulfatireducens TaxID=2911366 RepID=A0ABS9KIV6_9BACT|nr:polysaccharide pyruvyl transferase family protein [Rhodohalobacter sulfatireducens]MCG2590775.1 polysaccharide pyruvyl transferase family protein [Rhodohalobacter sulfatireducens]
MNIEIKGIGFTNKGAELMLHAILQKVRSEYPDATFVVKPNYGESYDKRAELGIYHKLDYQHYSLNSGKILGKILPKGMRRSYGLIREDEIDLLLDASGLSYSDTMGIQPTKRAAKQFKQMKNNGAKIVLLPQAFGPFKNPKFKKYLQTLYDHTDFIYARDEQSKAFFSDNISSNGKIQIAPDFTNLLEPIVRKEYEERKDEICVIPNYRMIDKTDQEVGNRYVSLMAKIIQELINRDEKIFLLIHEDGRDVHLAEEIKKVSGHDLDILNEADPLKIKGIISQTKGVISSRFHGIVNAMSQGVPALATGWHHKYKMLFRDYDFLDGLISVDISDDELKYKIDNICDKKKRDQASKKIATFSNEFKETTEKMWVEIFKFI